MSASIAELQFQNDGPILAQYARENEFDGRAYKDPFTGEQYPSVTTILKNTPKGDLMRWSARMVAERARDRPDIVLGDPDKIVDRLQYAPTDYRDERGWIGSRIHKMVEAELRGLWYVPEDLTDEEERIFESFEMFRNDYEVEPVLTEATVLIPTPNGNVMGTLDGVLSVRDILGGPARLVLTDIKTSKGLWPEHSYQVSALSKASHWFEMVPEGTEGAKLHKHPKIGKTWWLKHEFDFDLRELRILHLTQDGYGWEKVNYVEENFQIYSSYVGLWNSLKILKDLQKEHSFG